MKRVDFDKETYYDRKHNLFYNFFKKFYILIKNPNKIKKAKKEEVRKEYWLIYSKINIDKQIKITYNTEKRDTVKFIAYQQYVEYLKNNVTMKLKEKDVTYQMTKLEEFYDVEKIREVDKKHDKMFRNILSRKKEMASFLNQFLNLKDKIEEKQIIQCHTDFVTRQYRDRQSDIIYKIKDKPIYFLVEHQSSIKQDMPLRIWEYVGEIMRKESIIQETYLRKDKIYPVVVPIVIYTGFQKWKVPTSFAQKQYQSDFYKEYQINLEYNLIAVQNYTFEDLLEKETLFSSIMIIEKCRTKEETNIEMNKIIEVIKKPKDKEALSEIVTNIITPIVGKEEARKMLEKINRREEIAMSPFTKMLFDLEHKGWKKGLREGEMKGEARGEIEAIRKAVKNMLQFGEPEEKIMKYTGISKEELDKIKGMLIHS